MAIENEDGSLTPEGDELLCPVCGGLLADMASMNAHLVAQHDAPDPVL